MTKDEIQTLKVGVEAVTDSIMKPVSGLIDKILGPIADEIGADLKEKYLSWRGNRRNRLLSQTGSMVVEAGFEPVVVSPPLLINIFQNGSVEDDDDLQDRWAALLANAANPQTQSAVLPSFPEILKQLSSLEAKVLDRMYDDIQIASKKETLVLLGCSFQSLMQIYREFLTGEWGIGDMRLTEVGDQEAKFKILLGNFVRLGLVELNPKGEEPQVNMVADRLKPLYPSYAIRGEPHYQFTPFGEAFIKACRKPERSQLGQK